MDWSLFRAVLIGRPEHHERPQEVATIDHGISLVKEGLALLAKTGHLFHLSEGPLSASSTWPRTYFHLKAAPRGHLVFCPEDLSYLGEGWFLTLDEAKHADGMGQQFRRGGIFPKRALPALISDYIPTPLDKESRNESR